MTALRDLALTGAVYTAAEVDAAIAAAAGGDPVADALGAPDTAFEFDTNSLSGLTAIGSPDAEDADTTMPGHYYLRDDDGAWVGRYVGSLTPPFTVVTKITDRIVHMSDGYKYGLFVGDASPSLSGDADVNLIGNASNANWVELAATSNIYSGQPYIGSPAYLAIRVNSSSDVDHLFSMAGVVWRKTVDSRNPGIGTIATAGIVLSGSALMAAAFDYLRIWNSAKTFVGALA